jgi:signal transduction protein with GAF and PtsI domain
MSHRLHGVDDEVRDLAFVGELRTAIFTAIAADTIGGAAPPDQLLEMIVRAAARAIPCPEGALMLVDQERQILTFEVVIGSTADTVLDLTVPLGHGIAGLVAVTGQALAIANAQEDPRHARDVAEKSGYLPTTILAVPVISADGTSVGVLELLDRQG